MKLYIAGTSQTILWGEVDKVDGELIWCKGGAKLPKEIAFNGTTDEPFFLVSLASPFQNLNAIPLNRSDVTTAKVHCLYSKDIFDQCKVGTRVKELTALEKLMNKYG